MDGGTSTTRILLFRGINVGGRNLLPMRDLVRLLEDLDLRGVRTYIQSGNVVLRTHVDAIAGLADRIGAAVLKDHGFAPHLLVLGRDELEAAIAANPYPEADAEPSRVHLTFLAAEPDSPDLALLERIARPTERFRLEGRVFYLHAPDGIGRSRLAARIEPSLGVFGTTRNWRTVRKVAELAASSE